MRWLLLLLLLALLPSACAGTPGGPDLVDPAGDAGETPCSAATDLLAFWADWDTDALVLHYRFSDLSAVESYAMLQDGAGRCFYSYNDLTIEIGNRTSQVSVYMDHNSNVAFETGWRFYLQDSRDDLEGTVDVEAGGIEVRIPYDLVGTPSVGDRVGDFRIQVVNAVEGDGLAYQSDWAPDDAEPCGCWVVYGAQANGTVPAGPDATSAPAEEAPSALALLPLVLAMLARRRK